MNPGPQTLYSFRIDINASTSRSLKWALSFKFFEYYERIIASLVRSQVLTAASVKITVSWYVAPCNRLKFIEVSKFLAASIIRHMSKPRAAPWWWRQQAPLKHLWTSTILHGATTHKTVIFIIPLHDPTSRSLLARLVTKGERGRTGVQTVLQYRWCSLRWTTSSERKLVTSSSVVTRTRLRRRKCFETNMFCFIGAAELFVLVRL
jgi:hypothetical protein